MKKCPKWDCDNGFYKVLKSTGNIGEFVWVNIKCPICNGTGIDPAQERDT